VVGKFINARSCGLDHLIVTQLFSTGLNELESVYEDNASSGRNNESNKIEGSTVKPENQTERTRKSAQDSPFGYAISCWLKHAMDVPHGRESTSLSESLWELVRDFFWGNSGANFAEWLRVYTPQKGEWHYAVDFPNQVRCLASLAGKSSVANCIRLAASYGLVDILEWAHPIGVEFNVGNRSGTTPLMTAIFAGEEGTVKAILSKNSVDINQTRCGDPSAAIEDCNRSCQRLGGTALEYTVEVHRLGMMELLLKQPSIEVDMVCHGYTALGRAIQGNYTEGIALLVGAGAKLALYNGEVLTIPTPS
jgi:hypothetical protein